MISCQATVTEERYVPKNQTNSSSISLHIVKPEDYEYLHVKIVKQLRSRA